MVNSEIDTYFSFLLDKLSELYQQVSKELTKRVSNIEGLNKFGRKEKKIQILLDEKKGVMDSLIPHLNREFGADISSKDYSPSGFFDSIFYLSNDEPVAGSYGTKYDFGQGPVDE